MGKAVFVHISLGAVALSLTGCGGGSKSSPSPAQYMNATAAASLDEREEHRLMGGDSVQLSAQAPCPQLNVVHSSCGDVLKDAKAKGCPINAVDCKTTDALSCKKLCDANSACKSFALRNLGYVGCQLCSSDGTQVKASGEASEVYSQACSNTLTADCGRVGYIQSKCGNVLTGQKQKGCKSDAIDCTADTPSKCKAACVAAPSCRSFALRMGLGCQLCKSDGTTVKQNAGGKVYSTACAATLTAGNSPVDALIPSQAPTRRRRAPAPTRRRRAPAPTGRQCKSPWMTFKPGQILRIPGKGVVGMTAHNYVTSPEECEKECDKNPACQNFLLCGKRCDFRDAKGLPTSERKPKNGCKQYYKCTEPDIAKAPPYPPTPPACPKPKAGQNKHPGAQWTEEEALVIKAKIVYALGGHGKGELANKLLARYNSECVLRVGEDLGKLEEILLNSKPGCNTFQNGAAGFDIAKLLRMTFHDCLRYQDCSGGCDGCLSFHGMHIRYLGYKPNVMYPATGDNNDLGYTADSLELIYQDPNFPSNTPPMPGGKSMAATGKSRADLWAFAGLVAIEIGFQNNDQACSEHNTMDKNVLEYPDKVEHNILKQLGDKCYVGQPSMNFMTGRQNCQKVGKERPFEAQDHERHPNAHMNGSQISEWFKDNFPDWLGKHTVAIMGGHGLGGLHLTTMFGYTWTRTGKNNLNNQYYKNMAEQPQFMLTGSVGFPGSKPWKQVWQTGVGGGPGKMVWRPVRETHTKYGAPFCWTHIFEMCPICYKLKGGPWKNRGIKFKAGMLQGKKILTDECCRTCYEEKRYDQDCMTWTANDEMGLNSDVGLMYKFGVTSYGRPTGCPGLNQERWEDEQAWLRNVYDEFPVGGAKMRKDHGCPKQDYPSGDGRQLHQVVEQYAADQDMWVKDFLEAIEKVQHNGYVAGELRQGPSVFGKDFYCENDRARQQWVCKRKTSRSGGISGGPVLAGLGDDDEAESSCLDVTEVNNPGCYGNVTWAKETGIYTHAEFYSEYPTLTKDSSFADFQYILHEKLGPGGGPGWTCPMPCTSLLFNVPEAALAQRSVANEPEAALEPESSLAPVKDISNKREEQDEPSSMPLWTWILLAAAGVLILASVGFMCYKSGAKSAPKKKTRATKAKQRDTPEAAPESSGQVRTLGVQPLEEVPAAQLAPVLMAQPSSPAVVVQQASPVVMAYPGRTYIQAPVVQAAAQAVPTQYHVPMQATYVPSLQAPTYTSTPKIVQMPHQTTLS